MKNITCNVNKVQSNFDSMLENIARLYPERKMGTAITRYGIPAIWEAMGFDVDLSHQEKTERGGIIKFPCAVDPKNPKKCVATAIGFNYDPYGKQAAPFQTSATFQNKKKQLNRDMRLSDAQIGFLAATTRKEIYGEGSLNIHVYEKDNGKIWEKMEIPVKSLSTENVEQLCGILGVAPDKSTEAPLG